MYPLPLALKARELQPPGQGFFFLGQGVWPPPPLHPVPFSPSYHVAPDPHCYFIQGGRLCPPIRSVELTYELQLQRNSPDAIFLFKKTKI